MCVRQVVWYVCVEGVCVGRKVWAVQGNHVWEGQCNKRYVYVWKRG